MAKENQFMTPDEVASVLNIAKRQVYVKKVMYSAIYKYSETRTHIQSDCIYEDSGMIPKDAIGYAPIEVWVREE